MNNIIGLVLTCGCCDKVFAICKSCYRGHKYCSESCCLESYDKHRKKARIKFEKSIEAKLDHADRQARYRKQRKKVTDNTSKELKKNINVHPHEKLNEFILNYNSIGECISCKKVLFPKGVHFYGGSI